MAVQVAFSFYFPCIPLHLPVAYVRWLIVTAAKSSQRKWVLTATLEASPRTASRSVPFQPSPTKGSNPEARVASEFYHKVVTTNVFMNR